MNNHVEEYRLAALDWVDKQRTADLLNETKKDVLAQMMDGADGSSNVERERNVRISTEWREHQQKILDANHLARVAKAKLDLRRIEWETCGRIRRTLEPRGPWDEPHALGRRE